jgi:hypothetical protein
MSIASFTLPSITPVEGLRLTERDPVPSDGWTLQEEGIPSMYEFDPEGRDMIPFTEHAARTSGKSKLDYLHMGPLQEEGYDDVHGGICPAGKLASWSKDFQDVGCDFVDWDSRYDVHSMADFSLPWLHDMFVDSTQQTVRFVLSNRKLCMKACLGNDKTPDGVRCKKAMPRSTAACEKLSPSFDLFNKTFKCEFSNGDVVESQRTQSGCRSAALEWALLVQCPLPVQLQNKTDARVNLVAPSLENGRVRKLTGLPLCSSMARRNVHHYSLSDRPNDLLATTGDTKAFAPLSRKQFDLGVCLWLTADQQMVHRKDLNNGTLWRLKEWLQHHVDVGVGHFFVYDNSKQPSIEMAQVLEPFVKSGRASLVHWPQRPCRAHKDCAHEYSGWMENGRECYPNCSNYDEEIGHGCHGSTGFMLPGVASSQFTMDLSCLQRFGEFTKSMAFIDVDEFLVPRHPHKTVQSVLTEAQTDVDGWRPSPILARKCSMFKDLPSEGHIREHFTCTSDVGKSNQKMIVNPDRMMIHQVHFGVCTWNMTTPQIHDFPEEKFMMVHAREESPIESWQRSEQLADAMKQFDRPSN